MRLPAIAFIALALAACGNDAPPAEPQVAETAQAAEPADAAPPEAEDTDLRDHMQSPIDKAKAVEDLQEDYDSEQAEEIDEQSDG